MKSLSILSALALVVTFAFCCVRSEQTQEAQDASSLESSNHQPQKRSVILEPDTDLYAGEVSPYADSPFSDSLDADKRSSLFRFGKRGSLFRFGKRGSLFRFGKRGSLFRFGKRGGLLRYGKRGGTLFRFGRSGPSTEDVDERSLYRDLDFVRDDLDSEGYPLYEARKRDVDGFHWGQEQS